MCASEVDVVVVGAGIAGLVAARDIARAGLRVCVLEQSARPGGRVRPESLGGIPVELGAESFATRGGAVADLLAELGLTDAIVSPRQHPAWTVTHDDCYQLPASGALGIPVRPFAADTRRVLGLRGAFALAFEPWRPRSKLPATASLAAVVRDRLGQRVLEALVAPVVEGVYSASPDSMRLAAHPELAREFARTGSLLRAARRARASRQAAGGAVRSLAGGMSVLGDRLVAELEASTRGETAAGQTGAGQTAARTNAVATISTATDAAVTDAAATSPIVVNAAIITRAGNVSLTPTASGWTVQWTDGVCNARAVVLAVSPEEVDRLLAADTAPDTAPTPAASQVEAATHVETASHVEAATHIETATHVETVALVISDARLDVAPRGTGALIPAGHPRIMAKALTHMTAKWAWLAEAVPPGTHVLRLSYGTRGGVPATRQLSDSDAAQLALRDASEVLGVRLDPARLTAHSRARWTIPARAPVPPLPEGIVVTGDGYAGTGLASVIPHARAAARSAVAVVTAATAASQTASQTASKTNAASQTNARS